MDNESIEKLRFDSRLVRRRNWVSPEQLEQELAALPDVSDKIRAGEDEDGVAQPAGADGGLPGGQGTNA